MAKNKKKNETTWKSEVANLWLNWLRDVTPLSYIYLDSSFIHTHFISHLFLNINFHKMVKRKKAQPFNSKDLIVNSPLQLLHISL